MSLRIPQGVVNRVALDPGLRKAFCLCTSHLNSTLESDLPRLVLGGLDGPAVSGEAHEQR